ncbi:pilus assembly protein PilM [bacterium]|nr:pilus assembly protein PilM [bacterium]MCI0601669.1 pilus assembly protein PilM [bacterium]
MAKTSFVETWKHIFNEPAYPNVGIEINSDCIRLAVVRARKGKLDVDHMDTVALPAGAVQVSPFKPNILELEPVAEALKDLWSRNRNRSPKVCLLVQDRAALAFSVTLESAPANPEECMELLRFKLKKSIPFRVEDAQISYFLDSGASEYHSRSLWVAVMNSQVLHQYEEVIQSVTGSECGLVDLATFNFMNLAHTEIRTNGWGQEDHLYVNLNRDYISLAITQKEKLMFFRSREMERHDGLIDEALAEIHPAMMFYQDKLAGQQLERAFVYALERGEELCRNLEQIHRLKSVILNPAATSREAKMFAPLLGLLMSRKVEFL